MLNGHYSVKKYPQHLRRIRFKDPESGKTLIFLTNHMALPALTIAALYKSRWQVELFFKWIKQHLTDAFASAVSGPTASASAFVDPVFSFAAGIGPDYSFRFSDGIGNSPVPEPPVILLLALGALVLGRRLGQRAIDNAGAECVETS